MKSFSGRKAKELPPTVASGSRGVGVLYFILPLSVVLTLSNNTSGQKKGQSSKGIKIQMPQHASHTSCPSTTSQ